jgi:hypothetical protein
MSIIYVNNSIQLLTDYQILMLYSLKKYHKMIYVNLSSYISCQQKEWEQKLICRIMKLKKSWTFNKIFCYTLLCIQAVFSLAIHNKSPTCNTLKSQLMPFFIRSGNKFLLPCYLSPALRDRLVCHNILFMQC